MIVPGLISVTFRERTVDDIAALAAGAGLRAVEWGADVHVPPGDAKAADRAARAAADHGLAVVGYGSYHRAGDHPVEALDPIFESALRLGSPTVRIWAGSRSSADADASYRSRVVDGVTAAVHRATVAGLAVALEFHGGTLTDTAEGAVALCRASGAASHWQPPVGLDDQAALAGLDVVAPHLSAVHVFSWAPDGQRLPLGSRRELWSTALARVAGLSGSHPALLEFVAGDDPANLAADAVTLLDLVAGVPA